jgi:magnesium chelatase family protein
MRKAGSSLDIAIAIGILVGSEQLTPRARWAMVGELSLGGELRPVPGMLPLTLALRRRGVTRLVVPFGVGQEARLVPDVEVVEAAALGDVVELLTRRRRTRTARARVPLRVEMTGASDGPSAGATDAMPVGGRACEPGGGTVAEPGDRSSGSDAPDLAEVRGQAEARRAVEVAIAGGHCLTLVGPPGSGKTLRARTIGGLLPPLEDVEALAATIVASAADTVPSSLVRRRLRSPHHTASYAAMVGGDSLAVARRGELASGGDAVPGRAAGVRAGRPSAASASRDLAPWPSHGQVVLIIFPARFQLVAA